MLFNSKTSVMPVPVEFARLQPGEMLFHSFLVTETIKQGLGYQLCPSLQYRCHFTNQRLLLEPIAAESLGLVRSRLAQIATPAESEMISCFEIPLEMIQRFKRILGRSRYAQIVFAAPLMGEALVLAPFPADLGEGNHCPGRFVDLGNRLLGDRANAGMFMRSMEDNPAKVAEFQQAIQTSPIPVLVDFIAPGCKPCAEFEPIVVAAVQPFGDRLTILRINLEEAPSIPMQYKVDCFPTLLLFKDGAIVERIVGVIPAEIITKVIYRHFRSSEVTRDAQT
jgi:thioredoxin 1